MLNCSHAQISRESPSAECVFWRLKPSNNFKWNNLFINLSPISILLKRETLPPHFSIYYYCIVRDKWFLFSYMIRKTHRFSLRNDTTQITFLPTYPLAPRETPISVAKFLVFDLFVESVMVFLVKLVFFYFFPFLIFFKCYLSSLVAVDSEWSYWLSLVGLRKDVYFSFSWDWFLFFVSPRRHLD